MKNKPNIGLIIIVAIFLISSILAIASACAYCYHAISNPTLTRTQNLIWLFNETEWWIPTVAMIISYLIIAIFTKKMK